MIPIRELSLRIRWLQGRRLACAHCGGKFTCLAEGNRKISTTGIPLLSSDEGMQAALRKAALERLRKEDARRGWEVARCPGCRRYQPWMVRRSRLRRALPWGFGPFLAAWILTGLPPLISGSLPHLGIALGLGTGGGLLGLAFSLRPGAFRGDPDPRGISDEDLRTLLDHAKAVDGDPLVEWYLSFHEEVPKKDLLLTMGFRDATGEDFLPEEVASAAVLEEHARATGA